MNKAVTFPEAENTPTPEEFSTFLKKYILAGHPCYRHHREQLIWPGDGLSTALDDGDLRVMNYMEWI